ncbi:MAG TPA: glycosyl hydrolase family 39 [Terriglobales bacterium]
MKFRRGKLRYFLAGCTFAVALLAASSIPSFAQSGTETVVVDATAPSKPFPHFWEQMFGSGRAILSLRESYRSDLREVKKVTDFRYVRFHNILHDEVGVYDEDEHGNPIYNFAYVDQIYDGLLANGVRPVVEISFMPKKLASDPNALHPFWYKQNVSPPKDYAKWDALMRAFAQHLVDRYGIDEISKWYFEVWNEPNIDFWAGEPKQSNYFTLYEHTARALKAVNPKIRVGGPATSSAHWVDDFIAFCAKNNVPVDFISSHSYEDDTVEDLFGTKEDIPTNRRLCLAIGKVHKQIAASAMPSLPLFWTEWNVASYGEHNSRDTIYVGAALADDVRQCDGLVDMMSFWTFSDVFEENGPIREPFEGHFGLIAEGGIKKPSYNGFALLHRLGDQRLESASNNVLVTRRGDGKIVVAAWNRVEPDQNGSSRKVRFEFRGINPKALVSVSQLDATHGNTLAAYEKMGKPRYPTLAQVAALNRAAELGPPRRIAMQNGAVEFELTPNELLILEVGK